MQESFSTNNQNLYSHKCLEYKNTKQINIKCNLNKLIIDKIIKLILIDFCNITVMGYNTFENKYWCKKYNKNYCILYLNLKIYDTDVNCCEIIIEPIIYSPSEVDIFIKDFNISIHMYKTSNFIKCIMNK